MTDKQYITGAQAVHALADGKKVRDVLSGEEFSLYHLTHGHARQLGSVDRRFEIVQAPATDEELIAEMERRARKNETDTWGLQAHVGRLCARMLRERSVKP